MIAARGTINKIVNRAMPAKVIWRSCQSKPRFRDRKRTIANYTGQHSRASQAMHVPKWRGHRELHHAHEPTHSRFGRDSVRFTVAANQERLSGSNDQPPTPRRSKPSNNRRSSVVGRRRRARRRHTNAIVVESTSQAKTPANCKRKSQCIKAQTAMRASNQPTVQIEKRDGGRVESGLTATSEPPRNQNQNQRQKRNI